MADRTTRARLALALLVAGCLGNGSPLEPLPAGGYHVLFIGNSLTYTNDLPGTLADLAEAAGDTIRVRSVSLPNYAVIDHAYGGSDAIAAIKLGGWHLVVLQQGPTTTQLNRDTLVLATQILDPYVRNAGGRTANLMTWPTAGQPHLFDAVRTSCQIAAAAVGGVFMPGGEAWRAALAVDPSLPLYGSDGYHPAPLGTYLLALVIYEQVTGHDAQALPPTAVVAGQTLGIPPETVRLLQRIAHETVVQFGGA